MIRESVTLVMLLASISQGTVEALSCYSCSGSDCLNSAAIGQLTDCGTETAARCFTQFNGYVPTRRGCWSSLTATEQSVCPGNACEVCTEDYCNLNSHPTHKCIVCSSVRDGRCASNPSELTAEQCGAATLNVTSTQCYSRVIGSVTERGCVRSQTDLDVCDGSLCETCSGEGCNGNEYPANRQKCVKCSGAMCDTATATDYCEDPFESCASVRRSDGAVVKNCESSLSETDQAFCQANPASCSRCTQNECNKGRVDFSASRRCYACQGTDCLRSSVEIETCYNIDDVCYSLFDGFNPVGRGCKSALSSEEKDICDNAVDVSCDLCSTDTCNLNSREDHQCNYCSSVTNSQCITSPNSVVRCPAPTTEVSEEAQCFTRIIGNITERGCLGTPAADLECKNSENCQMCAIEGGAACNTGIFPQDRIKCVVNTTPDQYCSDPRDSCVQIMQGSTRSKKCRSSMTAAEVTFCQTNSNKCDFCTGDNCNAQDKTFNYLECISCSSCIDSSAQASSVEQCATCVTMYSASSATVQRGCLSSLTAQQQQQCSTELTTTTGISCSTCSTNRCNAAVYPIDRLSCYTCLEGSCFSHDSIKLEFCPTYAQDDSCMIQMDSSGKLLHLGCRSSLSPSQNSTCNANANLCKTCIQPGCNKPSNYLPSGSCVQCNSLQDPDCLRKASRFDAEPCNDPTNTQCYSRLLSSTAVERGCVSDLDTASNARCSEGTECRLCSSPTGKCNSAEPAIIPGWRDPLSCYTCLEGSCFSHDSIKLEYCPANQQSDTCMIQMDSAGKLVRLGCKSALSSSQTAACDANVELCKTCNTPGCNTPSNYLPSGSCVQCSSANDLDCIGRASKYDAEPCNDPTNTQCYSRLLSRTVTERGCMSDLDSASTALCVRGAECSLCASPTGKCNSLEYPAGWRRCFQCDSAVDSNCRNAQTGTAPYCATYSDGDQCYTIVQQNGHTVRKCSNRDPSQCAGAVQCEICLFNGCNNRASTDVTPVTTTTVQPSRRPSPASRPIAVSLLATMLLSITITLCALQRTALVR